MANVLVAYTENAETEIKKMALETLRKLALGNPKLCAWSGGIQLLIDSVVDPSADSLSESVVLTLLYLMNDADYRDLIYCYLDLPKLFFDFTDIDTPADSAG